MKSSAASLLDLRADAFNPAADVRVDADLPEKVDVVLVDDLLGHGGGSRSG
jgi:hypothetical protein